MNYSPEDLDTINSFRKKAKISFELHIHGNSLVFEFFVRYKEGWLRTSRTITEAEYRKLSFFGFLELLQSTEFVAISELLHLIRENERKEVTKHD